MTTVVRKTSTTKVISSKYTDWWKVIIYMAEKGRVKLKCPEKVYPTTNKPYPEVNFFQCIQFFEAPGCSSSYINLHTCFIQKYWYQHTNGTTHKLFVQRNYHNEEQMKIGKTKRQKNLEFVHFLL